MGMQECGVDAPRNGMEEQAPKCTLLEKENVRWKQSSKRALIAA